MDELELEVTETYGAKFWKTLAEWAPGDPMSFLVTRFIAIGIARSQSYGSELPDPNVSMEDVRKSREANDSKNVEMICKIIDL